MRDLTTHELDSQLGEQLPARELMGSYCCGRSYSKPSHSGNQTTQSNSTAIGNGNGNGNGNAPGGTSILSGNGDGNFNGDGNEVINVNG